jgi:mono/diheme cytochrome c family protein
MDRRVTRQVAPWLLGLALAAGAASALAAEPKSDAGPEGPAAEDLDTLLKPVAAPPNPNAEAPPVTQPRVPPRDLNAARARPNPVADDPKAIPKGRLLFAANCRVCHAIADGGPDPDSGFSPPPRDFAGAEFQAGRTDGEIFYVIKNGVDDTAMLAWASRLTDREIWYLVAYIRTLAGPDTP